MMTGLFTDRESAMSAMVQPSSIPPPGLYQSQWWVRLASFSTDTGSTQKLHREESDAKTLAHRRNSATKRGFREKVQWPLSLGLIDR